jgi:two-component system, NarL family, response regulator DevR
VVKGEEQIRLVVLDELPAIRDAVRLMCEEAPDLELLGEGTLGQELPALDEADVIVVGIDSSVELDDLARIRTRSPGSHLVLLVEEDEERLRDLLRGGADAAVSKRAPVTRIVDVIRSTAAGRAPGGVGADREPHGTRLSSRERQVLALLAQGRTNREMADALGIAVRTTTSHIAAIYRKLGVNGRVEATRRALELRLVPRGPETDT